MKGILRCLAVTAGLVCAAQAARGAIPDGRYYGYEPGPNLSPDQPKACWFHENTMTVTGEAIRVETSPMTQVGSKIMSSASDGGFYSYEGTQEDVGSKTVVRLRLMACDYCGINVRDPLPSKTIHEYTAVFGKGERVEINGVAYGRARKPTCHPGRITTR